MASGCCPEMADERHLLTSIEWRVKYTPEDGDLVETFHVPALSRAIRYDRTTGYFSASALTLAARGIEGLVGNDGRMRLIVGCTLEAPEIRAIEEGISLQECLSSVLGSMPLVTPDDQAEEALELLAWMVAKGCLAIKIAVPCDTSRRPIPGAAIFHAKGGIVEDREGHRLAFTGSVNETAFGWKHNWESFHVFTSWGGTSGHVDAEDRGFQTLWADRAGRARVVDLPIAIRMDILRFLPPDDQLPRRLLARNIPPPEPVHLPDPSLPASEIVDPRRLVWRFINHAPTLPQGGERVGEATSAITPWPHQIRAFHRLYDHWPPKLLIADEVGLGKTIQAGMFLRQAWLSGKAKRILVMVPKSILKQWQLELREKFNLNWPIYNGNALSWYPSPGFQGCADQPVAREAWHRQPFVLTSSHLMRRRERTPDLLEQAESWDLIVLDEAHHARRSGGVIGNREEPNLLLRLMRKLRERTRGLLLLTATPMQVSPVEVWDLLALLGMPPEWNARAFIAFFEQSAKPMPSHEEMTSMALLFRAVETTFGKISIEEAKRFVPGNVTLRARRILEALRDNSSIPLRRLESSERQAAIQLMKANTPVRRLVSRHTRELLRRYFKAGKLKTRIADRQVEDRSVDLSEAERRVYQEVEEYISQTYNNAAADQRTAIGFVMTIYRRRLASSFHALEKTLAARLQAVTDNHLGRNHLALGEDVSDDEIGDDTMDEEEANTLERKARALEEKGSIERIRSMVKKLPKDTKSKVLLQTLEEIRQGGYRQAIVFTQYTDTMDFLRDEVARGLNTSVMCFSGRGGEMRQYDGTWRLISREETKRLFREGKAEILICTDAAAEGLNFQFCGALINYDMPWNPMRVEQRIGRIDRLGQEYATIRIINLHYRDTVETDVYLALRERIGLFQTFVGRLQPILSRLPKVIADTVLASSADRARQASNAISSLVEETERTTESGFDLDEIADAEMEEPERTPPPYNLQDLGRILERPDLLPPGIVVSRSGPKDFSFQQPGMPRPVRVTVDPGFFDAHSDSVELWSPGGELFPASENALGSPVNQDVFKRIIDYPTVQDAV